MIFLNIFYKDMNSDHCLTITKYGQLIGVLRNTENPNCQSFNRHRE